MLVNFIISGDQGIKQTITTNLILTSLLCYLIQAGLEALDDRGELTDAGGDRRLKPLLGFLAQSLLELLEVISVAGTHGRIAGG